MKRLLALLVFALAGCAGSAQPDLDAGTVLVLSDTRLCTGIVVDVEKRYVLTNRHCIEESKPGAAILVKLRNEQRFIAGIVGLSGDRDLALLELPETAVLQARPFGDSDAVKPGDIVTAVGHPRGARWLHKEGGVIDVFPSQINSDRTIDHGNSGGPLFNERGEIVGVNSACMMIFGECMVGISISSNDARAVIRLLDSQR